MCTRLAYQAEHENSEAERNPKVGYRKAGGCVGLNAARRLGIVPARDISTT